MTYTPAANDRIIVRRTPSIHGGTGVMTGTVLEVLTLEGVEGILHFKDDAGGRTYLATNEQMAAIGKTQTIDQLPDPSVDDEPEDECSRGECLGIHRSPDGYQDCDGNPI